MDTGVDDLPDDEEPREPPSEEQAEFPEFEDLTGVPYDPDEEAARPTHVLYGPREVLLSSLLGGPLGGCVLLALNWARLGSPLEAAFAFAFGVLTTAWLGWAAVATFQRDVAIEAGLVWIGSLIGMYALTKLLLTREIARHRKLDGRPGTPVMAGVVGAICLGLIAPGIVTLWITADHYVTKGWEHHQNGEHLEAIEAYTRALVVLPYDPELRHNRGLVRDSQDDFEGALVDYEATLRLDPKHAFANFNRARVLARLGRPTEGLAAIDLHLEQNATDASAHLVRGALHQMLENHVAAVGDFSRAIDLYAKSGLEVDDPKAAARNYARRGALRLKMNDGAKAAEDYAKAAELDPTEHEYPERQGYALHLAGDDQAALAPLDRAVKLSANCFDAFHYRALVKADLDDHRGAADDLTKAIELYEDQNKESFAAYHYERAKAYLALGDLERAQEDCDEAIRREPRHPAPRRLRDQIRRELDDAGPRADPNSRGKLHNKSE